MEQNFDKKESPLRLNQVLRNQRKGKSCVELNTHDLMLDRQQEQTKVKRNGMFYDQIMPQTRLVQVLQTKNLALGDSQCKKHDEAPVVEHDNQSQLIKLETDKKKLINLHQQENINEKVTCIQFDRTTRNRSCKRAAIQRGLPRVFIRMKTTSFLHNAQKAVLRDEFKQISEDLDLAIETKSIEEDPSQTTAKRQKSRQKLQKLVDDVNNKYDAKKSKSFGSNHSESSETNNSNLHLNTSQNQKGTDQKVNDKIRPNRPKILMKKKSSELDKKHGNENSAGLRETYLNNNVCRVNSNSLNQDHASPNQIKYLLAQNGQIQNKCENNEIKVQNSPKNNQLILNSKDWMGSGEKEILSQKIIDQSAERYLDQKIENLRDQLAKAQAEGQNEQQRQQVHMLSQLSRNSIQNTVYKQISSPQVSASDLGEINQSAFASNISEFFPVSNINPTSKKDCTFTPSCAKNMQNQKTDCSQEFKKAEKNDDQTLQEDENSQAQRDFDKTKQRARYLNSFSNPYHESSAQRLQCGSGMLQHIQPTQKHGFTLGLGFTNQTSIQKKFGSKIQQAQQIRENQEEEKHIKKSEIQLNRTQQSPENSATHVDERLTDRFWYAQNVQNQNVGSSAQKQKKPKQDTINQRQRLATTNQGRERTRIGVVSQQISSRSPRSQSSNENVETETNRQEYNTIDLNSTTPQANSFSNSRQQENSSIPPSSVADKSEPYHYEEEEYKSMWADISEHTVGRNGSNALEYQTLNSNKIIDAQHEDRSDDNASKNYVEEDHETENSSIFYNFNTPFCNSIHGQVDLNSSFQGSASAASLRWGTGTDLGNSFFEEDKIVALSHVISSHNVQAYCQPVQSCQNHQESTQTSKISQLSQTQFKFQVDSGKALAIEKQVNADEIVSRIIYNQNSSHFSHGSCVS